MSTISELLIKIGADSSGLRGELNKSKQDIDKAFAVNPVNEFSGALTGASDSVGSMVSKLSGLAALAAGGFGLATVIDSAVQAGESIYQLQNRFSLTTAEAGALSKTMRLAGGDIDTAASAIMRLDKSYSSGSAEGEKAKSTLDLFGVKLTDTTGKMLPLNEQLKNLAAGYKLAQENGQQQEFLMNTLGTRGLALEKTLRNYAEAADNASKVQSFGIDPEEMHQAEQELQILKMQASQATSGMASMLVPIAQEYLPVILGGLVNATKFLKENRTEIESMIKTVFELIVAYKSLQAAKKVTGIIADGASALKNIAMPAATTAAGAGEEFALSKSQEAAIKRAQKEATRTYKQMEKDAVAAAKTMNLSIEETAAVIAKKMTEISLKSDETAAQVRAEMITAFQESAGSATEMGIAAREANNAIASSAVEAALSQQKLTAATAEAGSVATASGEKQVGAQEAASAATAGHAAEEEGLAAKEALAGTAGEEAGAKEAGGQELAQGAAAEHGVEQELLTAKQEAAGLAGETAGAQEAGGQELAQGATAAHGAEQEALTVKEEIAGNTGAAAGGKIAGGMAIAEGAAASLEKTIIGLVSSTWNLAAAWAAVGYLVYQHGQDTGWKNPFNKEPTYTFSNGNVYESGAGDAVGTVDSFTGQPIGGYENKEVDTSGDSTDEEADQNDSEFVASQKDWKDNPYYNKELEYKQKAEMAMTSSPPASGGGGGGGGSRASAAVEKVPDVVHYSLLDNPDLAEYANQIQYAAETEGVDPNFLAAIILSESGGNQSAISSAGAIGLGQLMPDTAAGLGVNPYDANENIYGSAKYAAGLYRQFGDYRLAAAGYNAGGQAVVDYGGVPPYQETQNYVEKVMSLYNSSNTYMAPAGEATGKNALQEAQKKAQELKKAQQEAENLLVSMQNKVADEEESTYQQGMDKIVQDVAKKNGEIAKLQAAGVNVDPLKQELAKYEEVMKEKVTDKWYEACQQIKYDTRTVLDQVNEDYQDEADNEFEITLRKLNKERNEKLKAIQKDKDDAEARIAVENWMNAEILAAGKKRDKAIEENHKKVISAFEDKGDYLGLYKEMNGNPNGEQKDIDKEGNQKLAKEYVEIWDAAHASIAANIADTAGALYSSLDESIAGFIQGTKSAMDVVHSFTNTVLESIAQIVAKRAAANLVDSLLGSFLGGGVSGGLGKASTFAAGETSATTTFMSGSLSILPLADGGIVTAPTLAMVGEGGESEAVMPLSHLQAILGHSSSKSGGVQVNIINNSSASVTEKDTRYDDDLQQYVLDIVVDGAERNKGGFGRNLKTALGGS